MPLRGAPGWVPRKGSFRGCTSTPRPPSRCTRRPGRRCSPPSTRGTPTRAGCTAPRRNARLILDNAREAVAEALGVRRDEVSFTSSGTDAVHRGLLGLVGVRPRPRRRALARSSTPRCCTPLAWRRGEVTRRGARSTGRVDDGDLVEHAVGPDVGCRRPPVRQPRGRHPAAGRTRSDCPTAYPSSWTPAPRWAGSRCPTAGPPPPARRTSGAGRPGSACCWSARAPGGATRSRTTTGSTSGSPGFENVPAALAAAAALQAVVAERDEVNARQHALVDRIRAAGRPRSRTPRWSATRWTGSPTW